MDDLVAQSLTAWRINNDIILFPVDEIPPKGFAVVPIDSRGRSDRAVARTLIL